MIKIGDFQVALHVIFWSGAIKVSQNLIDAVVDGKRFCSKRYILLAFAEITDKQCCRSWKILSSLHAKLEPAC